MLSDDMFLYPYRIGQLRDGALVFLGSYSDAFGPRRRMTGGTMSGRKSGRSPSGDLLILASTVQGGAAIRQCVRRQGKRFIPQAVLDVASGPVPETVIYAREGLLVGTSRGRESSCSKGEGNTWYRIDGVPRSLYQPRILQLDDGRLCNFFHLGGDNMVGEIDQYVGTHGEQAEGGEPLLRAATRRSINGMRPELPET